MKRAFIKTLYKIIEYLYTGKTSGKVEMKSWRVNEQITRYELTFNDNKYKNVCTITFTTNER